MSFRNSAAESGSSPRNLRCSLTASFIKLAIVTPGSPPDTGSPGTAPAAPGPRWALTAGRGPETRPTPSVTVNFSLPASTDASVDLPEPLGPMMACTSPALTSRSMPRRISLPSTEACRFFTFNISSTYYYSRFLFSLSQVVSTAFRRVWRNHTNLNPSLVEGLIACDRLHDAKQLARTYAAFQLETQPAVFWASTVSSIGSFDNTSRA